MPGVLWHRRCVGCLEGCEMLGVLWHRRCAGCLEGCEMSGVLWHRCCVGCLEGWWCVGGFRRLHGDVLEIFLVKLT